MVILFIHFFFSYHLFDGLMECHRACQNVLMTSIDVFFDNDLIVFYFLVLAASSIANIVTSSEGPVGLDKMLVNDVGVCFFYSRFFLPNQLVSNLFFSLVRMSQSPTMELLF